jgi:hypothetical protein
MLMAMLAEMEALGLRVLQELVMLKRAVAVAVAVAAVGAPQPKTAEAVELLAEEVAATEILSLTQTEQVITAEMLIPQVVVAVVVAVCMVTLVFLRPIQAVMAERRKRLFIQSERKYDEIMECN